MLYSPAEGTARADMCSVNNYSTLSPTDLSYYQRQGKHTMPQSFPMRK